MRALRKTQPPATTESGADPDRELTYAIAQAVYDLRTQQGLSQGELAERVGTKQPRISVVESAVKLPSLPLLVRIASAFGMKVVISFEKTGDSE
ncbi:helix-turn-helix transcriptional regulator [Streptomyces sp. NPDC059761]|uniref:helix-turn-helix transcriptional regulator n=1 Tax=Streptomyces sp. NPDC059761 TaxID=3346937 RepID=UPI00365D9E4E